MNIHSFIHTFISIGSVNSAVKMLDYHSAGCEFKSQHCQVVSVGPLSEALNCSGV